ncbi:MAG TPA: glycosyltransferase [Chthoniobacter sp.]|nr:glycosyltransferase [Chthoniobacter sp.]
MSHLGLICPELSGHLNPMTTLGRELQRRGHRVTLIGRLDARRKTESAGLGFAPISEQDFPEGSMQETSRELGKLNGLRAVQFTAELLRRSVSAVLRDAPEVVAREKIDALLVDQVSPGGGTVADRVGLPWIMVSNALALNPDPHLPPCVLPWSYTAGPIGRARNAFGDAILRWLARPVIREINDHRRQHKLAPMRSAFSVGSCVAQLAQQPAFFEFPRRVSLKALHYTGPWHHAGSHEEIPFPWEKLDGRPLIYASMGTLQNRQQFIFETIAAACAGLDAQLVISLGSRDQDAAAMAKTFAGDPIVVAIAPQLALLQRATLAITHAGLNTALEALSYGVPMVAIPITNDQPGVAARLEWLGAAEVVQPPKLTAPRLRAAVERVQREPRYRETAQRCRDEILTADGLRRAADLVERTFRLT